MNKLLSEKAIVQILIQQCIEQGLKEVVISPGSRNAPLIMSFNATPEIECLTIVDERSAGFFALGMAQQLRRPVGLICTSGSAALNYAPAIVEAYYQEIPLVVMTADRPIEWLGQADGQTIPQSGMYQNYIRYQVDLPVDSIHLDDQWYTGRVVSEAFLNADGQTKGPVHINIPLREPLYGRTEPWGIKTNAIKELYPNQQLSNAQLNQLANVWNVSSSVMVICGVVPPDEDLNRTINKLAANSNTVVLTETTSNLKGPELIECIDRQVFSISPENSKKFQPELLISFGGQIVSKQIKKFLRENPPKEHWHISVSEQVIDTFQHLTTAVKMKPTRFFSQVSEFISHSDSAYKSIWRSHVKVNRACHEKYVDEVVWSDFKALSYVFQHIPNKCQLQLANSTSVRYAQLFQDDIKVNTFSNRGTSGIDGSVSTAVGAAYVSNQDTLLVTGDLSFFYDSNGLWNKYLKPGFKIIVMNNGGGGIFRFIPGPAETPELEEFFEAKHQHSARYVAKAFGVNYLSCHDENELESVFKEFINVNDQPALLEIFTPGDENGQILRDYFKSLK